MDYEIYYARILEYLKKGYDIFLHCQEDGNVLVRCQKGNRGLSKIINQSELDMVARPGEILHTTILLILKELERSVNKCLEEES